MRKRIIEAPLFLILLPVFFVLHGCVENIGIVFLNDAFVLLGWYILSAIIVFGICWLIFRNREKAGLFAFLLLAFNFFFGAIHDTLKSIHFLPILGRYVFILPFFFFLFIYLFIFVKRSRKNYSRLFKYLNLLFAILIVFDAFQLAFAYQKMRKKQLPGEYAFTDCPNCPRPDIYLMIADGYPSNIALKEALQYDNEDFLNALRARGFYIADSSISNYNKTPVSLASILNMGYVQNISGQREIYMKDMANALYVIRSASLPRFLESKGYKIYNHSIFDLKMAPSVSEQTFLPKRTSNIKAQTFIHRTVRDLGFHLIDKFKVRLVMRYSRNADLRNNKKLSALTMETSANDRHPKFVYTHLLMPHHPYYFDSSGRERPIDSLTDEAATNVHDFVQYLKYSNGQFLKMIDEIIANSPAPPVIVLAADHGFRNFEGPVDKKYHFMCLTAILTPGRDYRSYYSTISNVNLFRVLLNDQFKQNLPLLKDSTSFLY